MKNVYGSVPFLPLNKKAFLDLLLLADEQEDMIVDK